MRYRHPEVWGDGTHETHALMLEAMDGIDFNGKSVLDIGTGSGILAIEARKRGAGYVLAVDIDDEALSLARENSNGIDLLKSDLTESVYRTFDVVIANLTQPVQAENLKTVRKVFHNNTVLLASYYSHLTPNHEGLDVDKIYHGKDWDIYIFKKQGG